MRIDAPPPLPYFATVSPIGHIIPWRNIAYAETTLEDSTPPISLAPRCRNERRHTLGLAAAEGAIHFIEIVLEVVRPREGGVCHLHLGIGRAVADRERRREEEVVEEALPPHVAFLVLRPLERVYRLHPETNWLLEQDALRGDAKARRPPDLPPLHHDEDDGDHERRNIPEDPEEITHREPRDQRKKDREADPEQQRIPHAQN